MEKEYKFEIMTDSNADMNAELRKKYGLCEVFPYGDIIFPDGHREVHDLEWRNISPEEYYTQMKSKKNVFKSSVRDINEYLKTLEYYLAQGKDILVIALSAWISGCYNLFCFAKDQLLLKYPERKVFVVDSQRYSTSYGLMAAYASMKRDEGLSLEETYKWVEENKNRFHQMGPMDDLFYLHRAGRIPFTKAFFGTLVGVKPLGDFNQGGSTTVLGKAKGLNKAFAATIEYVKQTIEDAENATIFVSHTCREKEAQKLLDLLKAEIPAKEYVLTLVGQGCGANIGPGLIACYYLGKPISKDCEEEKVLLNKILANI